MEKRKKLLTGAALLLFLAFWLYVAWCVPYSQDDWDWGLEVGMEQWLTASLNNRYVGSFFVIIMTRSTAAKLLVLGGGMFAIPLLTALLVSGQEKGRPFLPLYLAANTLAVLLPQRIWRQTYGWVAGFANYGVSALMFLGWLLLLRWAFRRGENRPWPTAAGLAAYTFALGLFVETQSALDLLLALSLTAHALKAKRGRPAALGSLAGSALGFVVIFFNPVYGKLADTGHALGGIRNLSFPPGSGPAQMLEGICGRFFGELLPTLFKVSLSFSLLLALITALALWRGRYRPLAALALWPAVYGALVFFCYDALPELFIQVGGPVGWAIAIAAAALSGGDLPRRMLRMVLLLSGVAIIAPMSIVRELGGRLFLLTYLVTALTALDLAAPLLVRKPAAALCALLAAVQMFVWVGTYYDIAACSALRKELIQTAAAEGAGQVVIPTEDHEVVCWGRNPTADWRVDYYKQFYGIPEELEIIFLPHGSYEHWPNITQDDWDGATQFSE